MGKPVDTRVVEYAYVITYEVMKNVLSGNKNSVRISITYELKDSNKEYIGSTHKEHYIEAQGQLNDTQTAELVNANLGTLVLADKAELSGYQP